MASCVSRKSPADVGQVEGHDNQKNSHYASWGGDWFESLGSECSLAYLARLRPLKLWWLVCASAQTQDLGHRYRLSAPRPSLGGRSWVLPSLLGQCTNDDGNFEQP
jgi:hypothetical protein